MEERKKKTSVSAKLIIAAVLLLAVGVAQFIYLRAGNSRDLRMTDTGSGVIYEFDAGTSFHNGDAKFFYFCTKDGVKYVSSGGDVRWQEVFNLSKPIMAADGEYVAIGEAKGKRIYVYDANGQLFEAAFDDPALFFSINSTGYLAVILQLENGYEIRIYRGRGGEPIYRNVLHDPLILPVAAAVSADGRFLAAAFINYNIRMTARVAFYYINAQDAYVTSAAEEGLFAGNDYPGEMLLGLKFMESNRALVFTDARIYCYKAGDAGALADEWEIELHNRVDHIAFYGGRRFAFVTGDKLLNDDEAPDPGVVGIYNMSGQLTGEFALGRKATYLNMGHDSVLVGADRSFYALNASGERMWEYITLQDTRGMIFLDNTDTVLTYGGMRASILKRVKPKAAEAAEDAAAPEETPAP